jgi:hypothetical protein
MFATARESGDHSLMCTVVVSFEPAERVPLLLLGARDELIDRPWRPPGRHWPGSPLVGGLDEQAGGTWLAVHPAVPRMSCLLNGRGVLARAATRRSRGELPLRAAADGAQVLKELAEDHAALARYDPFHLVAADLASVWLLSWDGQRAVTTDLPPGTHVLVNSGHAYPEPVVTEPKAAHFGPKFAAARPSGDPALPLAQAWEPWLTLAAGDGLDPADPRALVARRVFPVVSGGAGGPGGRPPAGAGRVWGTTSLSLVALSGDGLRYDFQSRAGSDARWSPVEVRSADSP